MSFSSGTPLSQGLPKRGLISRILEPALYLWLRSQVESVETLKVQLESSDRQVLSGYLPQVRLEAQRVIYQGLHLSAVTLKGQNIRINMGQVLKGKALQLLEPVPVELTVILHAEDVQASLGSALLQGALIEALQTLVGEQIEDALGEELRSQSLTLQAPTLLLGEDQIRLSAKLTVSQNGPSLPVALQTGLVLSNPQTLILQNPEWLPTAQSKRGLPLQDLHGHPFNLGPHVQFHNFSITPAGIQAQGQIIILPVEP